MWLTKGVESDAVTVFTQGKMWSLYKLYTKVLSFPWIIQSVIQS